MFSKFEIVIRPGSEVRRMSYLKETRSRGMIQDDCHRRTATYCYPLMKTSENQITSSFSSMDSGLEAFSRNPTHGSFRALSCRTTLFTKYVTQWFLSY